MKIVLDTNVYIRISRAIDDKGTTTNMWELFIIKNSIIVRDKELTKICRDPDDNKFLNCALVGNADYLISGDKDLLTLKKVNSVRIVSPRLFIKSVVFKQDS